MLTGVSEHTIDSKNRIFIPAKHREELGESFIISQDIRGTRLRVYSFDAWNKYLEPIYKLERKLSERVTRYLHSSATQVTPDAQGRVILPPQLIKYAMIGKEAVVVGCGDHDEIWSCELWNAEREDIEEMREEMESLGL